MNKEDAKEIFDNERVSDQTYVKNDDAEISPENIIPDMEDTIPDMEDFNEEVDDVINHPSHYTREGAIESINEMIAVFGLEAVKHFCICNVWKYRYRAADKNGIEDIKKSDWYMAKYIDILRAENALKNNASDEIVEEGFSEDEV